MLEYMFCFVLGIFFTIVVRSFRNTHVEEEHVEVEEHHKDDVLINIKGIYDLADEELYEYLDKPLDVHKLRTIKDFDALIVLTTKAKMAFLEKRASLDLYNTIINSDKDFSSSLEIRLIVLSAFLALSSIENDVDDSISVNVDEIFGMVSTPLTILIPKLKEYGIDAYPYSKDGENYLSFKKVKEEIILH